MIDAYFKVQLNPLCYVRRLKRSAERREYLDQLVEQRRDEGELVVVQEIPASTYDVPGHEQS